MGKSGQMKGNQNNFNIYYNKEEDGIRVGGGDLRQEGREEVEGNGSRKRKVTMEDQNQI